MQEQIYQKETNRNIPKLIGQSLRDLNKSRFLAFQLAKRDISAQYRQSYLGIIWAFVPPLATAFVWMFLNSSGTVELTDTGIPYPVYAFAGTLLWSIVTEAINSPIQSTTAAKSILTKINFPKEALITSGILKLLFNSSVKVILLLIFIFFYGVNLSWGLLLFPFAILGGLIVGSTIGLLLTPIGMLYQDISKLITFGMQFIMYVTPVVFAVPESGTMKTIMEINPLTPIITVGRNLAVGLPPTYLSYFLIVLAACIPLFFIALVFYRISIPIFVERLSA
ncbi:ABC transporter permease [Flavobacterium sp. CS20]|uniref:ABC transporter permease n=1 Tax=Flavobacterium sp. CS20 TaxID=2775246 RepID=UPI001B3A0586|nr:ABC transporter permease [Flavobacterium sp. CS20]QTY27698.1 ABC transporter permease [Flavobacterium sp. CS20]